MKNLLLLKRMSLFLLFIIGSMQYTSAQSYKHLRISIDEIDATGVHIDHVRWKMGAKTLPVSDLTSIKNHDTQVSENSEVLLNASYQNFPKPAYKVFEKKGYNTYIGSNVLPATIDLDFKNASPFVTGIDISLIHGVVKRFRCFGSNNGSTWTLIYTSPLLEYNDFVGANRDFTASFGNSVPGSFDAQAPSVPSNLIVSNTTSIAADINWNASSDSGVGVLLYEIFINGTLWQTSETTSATVYGLSRGTNNTVQVKAVDRYGNRSALSNSKSINTAANYPLALRKINVGTGVGISNTLTTGPAGIFKPSASNIFAGDWTSNNVADGPFSQAFIDDMKKFSHIRFMDIININFNAIVNWNDRIQANNPNQRNVYHGTVGEIVNTDVLSYEWAIYLCNITDKDMWINIPANANENYVRQLATLIKNNLKPGLKVYLENSNETWNSSFPAWKDYGHRAFDLGLSSSNTGNKNDSEFHKGSHKYMVYKTVRVFEWFNDTFGNPDRVYDVLAGQAGLSTSPAINVSQDHLDALKDTTVYPNNVRINPNGTMPEFYALAPYFDLDGEDESEDGYTRMKRSIDKILITTQAHYNIWQPEGISFITYEGGIHMHDALRDTYSRDKGIYNAYMYYIDQLAPYYSSFTHYSYVFGNTNINNFGATDFVGQPLSDAPRLKALTDWIDANKNNPNGGPNSAPVIFENPSSVSVPNGVSKVPFSIATLQTPQSYQWFKNNVAISGENINLYTTDIVKLSDNGSQYKASATNSFGTNTSTAATLTVTNHHLDISQATTAPTIDGTIDGMWNVIASQDIANANKGTTSGNADLSGNFKIAWDATKLYLLVQVTDDVKVKDATGTNPEKYNFDGIEIYFNGDNAYTDSYNNDAQYVYNWEGGIHAFSGGKPTTGINVAQTNTANGYIMELAIPWSNIEGTAQNGSFLGFDIMLLDNDVTGSVGANEKKAWHTLINDSWKNPKEFASVQLTDGTSGTPPTITSQPSNVSASVGSNATFSVTASGSGLSYQWFKETTAIGGATSSTFTINSVSSSDAANYHVVVSNADGSVISNTVTLTVDVGGTDTIVSVTSPPEVTIGETVSVSVNYIATATRKIYFELKASDNSQFPVFMNNTVAEGSGTSTFTFTVPSHVNLDKDHLFVTYISEENTVISPWQDRFDHEVVPVTVNESTTLVDAIVSVTSPPEVTIGETVSVSVNYTATTTRKIFFELKASDNSQFPVFMNNIVAAGSGTSIFTFTVPSTVNLDKDHLFVTYISEENTVISPWQDRYDHEFVLVVVNDEDQPTTSYRYLRLTVNDYTNFSIREMDWVTATGSVPASAMTSNNSVGVIASNTEGWNNAFAVFDEVYDDNGYWIGDGTTPKYVTIDLGNNPAAPTAVKIYKAIWATLNGFKAEGTNNLSGSWDLLLSETNANGAFTTSSTAANVVEATFNFNSTASKIDDNKINFDDIKVFPNPVTRFLNVNMPAKVNGKLMMSLTSVSGKVILRKEIRTKDNNFNQIDFSRLANGLYLLEFRDDLNVSQHKIIKQ